MGKIIFFNQAQKRAATEEAEKHKREEIKALQGQLAALKEPQAGIQVEVLPLGLSLLPRRYLIDFHGVMQVISSLSFN
jgi:hypothetical protein